MKTRQTFPVSAALVTALCAVFILAGCAGVTPYEESVLIDAGFQPASAQDAAYAALPAYKVQHTVAQGRSLYAYRDERKGVTFIGGEAEYQRYQQLLASRGAARIDIVNQQMNQQALHSFRY